MKEFYKKNKVTLKLFAVIMVVVTVIGCILSKDIKVSKANENTDISVVENQDFSNVDKNIKNIAIENENNNSTRTTLSYIDGSREVAVVSGNMVNTYIYDKNNVLISRSSINVQQEISKVVQNNQELQNSLDNEEDDRVLKGGTKKKDKLPKPVKKGNNYKWKLNKSQVLILEAFLNMAGAVVTFIGLITGAICAYYGIAVGATIGAVAAILGAAFWVAGAVMQFVRTVKETGKAEATVSIKSKKVTSIVPA